MKICSRCIFDNKIPNIQFNEDGLCNYCIQIDDLKKKYKTGTKEGEKMLNEIISEIKKSGERKKYDCIIGVSGGTDSSFLLLKALEWGLRPLAVHYDNTWNTSIASENIRKVTEKLNIDLYTYVIDNEESNDIFKSFLLASVPEFDASTDIGFVQILRKVAAKYRVKYILEGHSFMAEGLSPQGNNYFDGKYIKSIHKQFGKRKLKTFPNLTFYQFLKWTLFYRQKFIRPLWYINYSKVKAKEILSKKTNWKDYGGHHLENRSTAFLHKYYNPNKFDIDNRNWSLSAEVRAGLLTQNEALKIYNSKIEDAHELVEYVKKRLDLNDNEFKIIMSSEKKTFKDYKTYKQRFEKWRPFFKILADRNIVPMSFYLKYCLPGK